jgi:hypothetical protein
VGGGGEAAQGAGTGEQFQVGDAQHFHSRDESVAALCWFFFAAGR